MSWDVVNEGESMFPPVQPEYTELQLRETSSQRRRILPSQRLLPNHRRSIYPHSLCHSRSSRPVRPAVLQRLQHRVRRLQDHRSPPAGPSRAVLWCPYRRCRSPGSLHRRPDAFSQGPGQYSGVVYGSGRGRRVHRDGCAHEDSLFLSLAGRPPAANSRLCQPRRGLSRHPRLRGTHALGLDRQVLVGANDLPGLWQGVSLE